MLFSAQESLLPQGVCGGLRTLLFPGTPVVFIGPASGNNADKILQLTSGEITGGYIF
jgi:hypothetical protein